MSKTLKRGVRIERETRTSLRVSTETSPSSCSEVLQTEQGAMIEVGAIIGANLLNMNDGDVLEISLIMHRKEG